MPEELYVPVMIAAVVAVVIIIMFAAGYRKAPPDKAFIISGLRRKAKVVIGKASVKLPFFERCDVLELALMSVDVKTAQAVPTADYINIMIDAVVNVKISPAPETIEKAQQNFLNKNVQYITGVAREVLEGNMREIVGQMRLEEMISNRQAFADKVRQNADPDLKAMGLEIVSFNVQNFVDDNGVINDMGIDNTMQIRKKAAISKAEAERDIRIAQAEANRKANDAKVDSETAIAVRQNELEIKQAELKRSADIKKAEADAAYKIQEEEQRKTIEITTANANLAKQEKEVEIKAKEAEIKERALEAEVKKTAEAQKYAAQQKADAELYTVSKNADARKYEDIRKAEAELEIKKNEAAAILVTAQNEAAAEKAKAEAARFAAEQEAEGIRAKGLAEAEAVRAKALAEAEGLDKKAEAMRKMEEAAVLQMYFEQMPAIASAIAKPLENIDKITMYGDGNTAKLVKDITEATTQASSGLLDGLGVDLKQMLSSFVERKVTSENNEKPKQNV
ncbi:MAG: flotillin family protein [Oscillospiraceae bacterium]|nr:flotillin family protein [Oscillospiraceae bacterium]